MIEKRRSVRVGVAALCVAVFAAAISVLACSPTPAPHSGQGSVQAPTPGISGARYSTNFPTTESPIGEDGRWVNGRAVGLDWHDVQSVLHKAYASAFSGVASRYDDSIAVLTTSFAPNQFAQGTVFRAVGYSPSASHEVELLLRFQVTAHSARGYEVLWGHDGGLAIVRWNGPLGNYSALREGPNIGQAVEGDVLRVEIVGGVISVFKNGSLVATGPPDTTWTDGQPGIGFWPKPGATLQNYGWKSYTAGSLQTLH
jgi:hypothetical protein